MKQSFSLLIIATALLLTSCFKDVAENTTYLLKPLVQHTSGAMLEPLEGVVLHAFEADTTLYTVASYDDALEGVVSAKANPSDRIQALVSAAPSTLEGMTDRLEISIPPREMMLLAVDTENRLYAYTQLAFEQNIGTLYVTLIFKTWKEGAAWKEGWQFCNPFFEPTVTIESFIEVGAQSIEGGATNEEIANVKVCAFAADTTEWRIASYDDAVGGRLTSKSDETITRSNPEFNGYETNTKGLFRMNVSASPLMVVVIDRTHRMYAYSKQEVDLTTPDSSPTYSVYFPLWQTTWISEQQGWRVVNPEYAPATDEEENNPENQE
ncbi:MAG: hypothetical protein Q4A18_04930 [Rikenellaceae bacterium]|nr:hypothetical protein [Rikenellaceae bacterium]